MGSASHESRSLESLIARLVDEFQERLERGESPDPDEFANRWPEHAGVIRQVLASLELLRLSSASSYGSAADVALGAADARGRLGDFQIVREVGRGGMGVVYEARQISLDRRVALKVMPFAGMLDPRQLQRFKNEAQAAAQLDHPHIVDVIAVGCERGVHYYAMRFIDGQTLAQIIAELRSRDETGVSRLATDSTGEEVDGAVYEGELSRNRKPLSQVSSPENRCLKPADDFAATEVSVASAASDLYASAQGNIANAPSAPCPPSTTLPIAALSTQSPREYYRSVARLMADIAEALDHAHQAGVVHRDVKPSNILIDARGKAWVTDFGVAQVQSNTELTFTGDVVGTLRYMSPEQAVGNRRLLDQRADVYSLGATLYELLALRPVFDSLHRQELLRQIADVEPLAPRRIRKSAPADLETIALKCLAKSRADRYSSSHALAVDLERWLRAEPIRARPLGPIGRGMRWARRNPVIAGLSGAVAAILLTGTIASSYFAIQSRLNEKQATLNALVAQSNLRLAKRNADEAKANAERAERSAASARANADKAEARAREAQANEQRAEEERFRADQQAAQANAVASFLAELFKSSDPFGLSGYGFRKGNEQADQLTARQLLDRAATLAKTRATHPLVRAALLDTIGNVERSLANYDIAEPMIRESLEIRRTQLGEKHPDTAASRCHLGWLHFDCGELAASEPLLRQALADFREALGADDPRVAEAEFPLAWLLASRKNDDLASDEAERLFRDVLRIRRLRAGNSTHEIAAAEFGLAAILLSRHREVEGLVLASRSLSAFRNEEGGAAFFEAIADHMQAVLARRQKQYGEAVKLHSRAIARGRAFLGDRHPFVLMAEGDLAGLLMEKGDRDAALATIRDVLRRARQTSAAGHPVMIDAMLKLAETVQADGDQREPEALYREVLDYCRIRGEPPNRVAQERLRGILIAQGRLKEAESLPKE